MIQPLMITSLNSSGLFGTESETNDQPDLNPTVIASVIGSFLGTMGAVIVIVTSLSSPVKAMSKRIIIMISLADLLQAFPTLLVSSLKIEYHKSKTDEWWDAPNACKWQSFLITSGAMLTFLWTLGLSQHMFLLVRFGLKAAYKAYVCLYALSVVPFAINIVAFHYNILGRDTSSKDNMTSWCWIRVDNATRKSKNFLAKPCPAAFWDGKAFEIICFVGVTVYCLLARYHLNQRSISSPDQDESSNEDDVYTSASGDTNVQTRHPYTGTANMRVNKILAIPLALIFIRIWGTINRITCYCINFDSKICSNVFMLIMENFCDPLQGFVNCILYKVSLNESCTCKCPDMLGEPVQRRIFKNRRRTPNSYEPVTVWVSPGNSSFGEDY